MSTANQSTGDARPKPGVGILVASGKGKWRLKTIMRCDDFWQLPKQAVVF